MTNEYLAIFSFMNKDKAVHALFLFLMSFMICAQMLVWGWLSENSVLKSSEEVDFAKSCYQITFQKPVSIDKFEAINSKLSFLNDRILDVAACSVVNVKNEENVTVNGSSETSVLLVSFYPAFSDSRKNDDLERILNDPTAMIMSEPDLDMLRMYGVVSKDGERYTYEHTANRIIIYVGDYDQKLYAYGLPVLTSSYKRFSTITDSVSLISIQCKGPLTSSEIAKMKVLVSEYSGATVSCYLEIVPSENIFNSDLGYIILFVALITMICVVDAVALVIYVLSLRQREFDIYRMSGATETKIFGVSFFHMTVLIFLSDILGTALFFPARELLNSLAVIIAGDFSTFLAVLLCNDLLADLIFGVWFGASLIRRSRKSIRERIDG